MYQQYVFAMHNYGYLVVAMMLSSAQKGRLVDKHASASPNTLFWALML